MRQARAQIILRETNEMDIAQIKAMINETWDWASLVTERNTLDAALGLYLNQILYDSTFGRVAMLDDEVAGVIFGCLNGKPPQFRLLLENTTEHALVLLNAPETEREDIRIIFNGLHKTYEELISGREKDYDGILEFFVVSEKVRGLGVGKMLWNELKDYLQKNNAGSIYVYTDTDCNYGFYDHAGFKKVSQQELSCDFSVGKWTVDVLDRKSVV